METVTFEIHHLITFKLEMVEFPELTSPKKWIQKGIDLLRKHTPRVLTYLSKQKVMAQLKDHKIIIKIKPRKKRRKKKRKESFTAFERRDRWTRGIFKVWIQKEKAKRLVLVVLEGLVIPFTPILALLPGPNIFFYIPALLLYYHLTSYLGLRKVDVDDLDIEIKHVDF
jgi:hypothetical protein